MARPAEMSRKELYDLVWSEPMRTLAKRFEISDVALGKTCRAANIPTPGLGYWAKKEAGKKVIQTQLPPRGLGEGDRVTIGSSRSFYGGGWSDAELDSPDPSPPTFDEPMDGVRARVQKTVGSVSVPSLSSGRLHPETRRLQENDDRIRAKSLGKGYTFAWDKPLFEDPVGRRRLRILNAVFLALSRAGAHPGVSRKHNPDISYTVGSQSFSLRLDLVSRLQSNQNRTHRSGRAKAIINPDALSLVVGNDTHTREDVRISWTDDENRLEERLTEIVVEMVVAGEARYREHLIAWHERSIKYRAHQREERRLRAIERERKDREQKAQLERERIEQLLSDARALREAEEIRAYVATVRTREAVADVIPWELEHWAAWALEQADRRDPVKSGRFRRGMDEYAASEHQEEAS